MLRPPATHPAWLQLLVESAMNMQAQINSAFSRMVLRIQMQSSVCAQTADQHVCLSEANRSTTRIMQWIGTHCGCALQTPPNLCRLKSISHVSFRNWFLA